MITIVDSRVKAKSLYTMLHTLLTGPADPLIYLRALLDVETSTGVSVAPGWSNQFPNLDPLGPDSSLITQPPNLVALDSGPDQHNVPATRGRLPVVLKPAL